MSHRPFVCTLLALIASAMLAPAPSLAASEAPAHPPKAGPGASPLPRARASAIRVRLADGRELQISDARSSGEPLARVDGSAITLGDLREAAAEAHPDSAERKRKARMDVQSVLDRLIGLRLITAEAHVMGLDELDEVKAAVQENHERVLLNFVRARALKGLKTDAREVSKRYAEAAKEWKLRSILFTSKDDAVAFGAAVAGGGGFEALATKAIADKKAKSSDAGSWLRASQLRPEVAKAVGALKPGQETAPLQVTEGWTVVRLEETRTGKDAKLRAEIESNVRDDQAKKILKAYYAGLKKKQVVIDEAVLKSVDFDSAKPFDALTKDTRVVARVAGDPKPITLGDVAEEVLRPLFHGIESAQREKRVDKQKAAALDALVSRKLVATEAAKYQIEALPEVKRQRKDFETNLIFSTFVDRVILPDVQVTDAMLKASYEKRKKEFTYPAFYRLDGLAFADAQKAQAALKSVQSGTDFEWLKANSETVPPAKGAPVFDRSTVSANALPDALRKALAGAREGDVRIYSAVGQTFVVRVASLTPQKTATFEEAKDDLAKVVHAETLQRNLDEFVAKLRKAHDVKVYLASAN